MNELDPRKSPGQNQIWKIAKAVLQEFPIDPRTAVGRFPGDEGYDAYSALLDRLANDPIVSADIYTGRRIIDKEVATSYVGWLSKISQRESAGARDSIVHLPINFNRMAFHGSSVAWTREGRLDSKRRLCEGGAKEPKNATARAILTLVNGDAVPTYETEVDYYRNSGILDVTNGNHRMIARKLLGVIPSLPAEKITVWNDYPNEELNQALLCLESLYTLPDPRISEITIISQADVELAIEVARKYDAPSPGGNSNELYSFTKHDLLDGGLKNAKYNSISGLKLLNLYAYVYQTLLEPRARTWWRQLLQRDDKSTITYPLSYGRHIRERWLTWRAGLTCH